MLKEMFIGRPPSHFHVNGVVKSFIVSETFFWSAWNFILPVFAVFAVNNISGGNIGLAASAYSTHLIARIIFEIISGKYLLKSNELKKYLIAIIGIILMSLGYLGLAFTDTIGVLYLFYGLAGVGFGVASPAKFSLFSTHLDKNKEVMEWGMYDAIVLVGMALAAALGGFIAKEYGFQILFFLASAINLLGALPYILYIHNDKNSSQ